MAKDPDPKLQARIRNPSAGLADESATVAINQTSSRDETILSVITVEPAPSLAGLGLDYYTIKLEAGYLDKGQGKQQMQERLSKSKRDDQAPTRSHVRVEVTVHTLRTLDIIPA